MHAANYDRGDGMGGGKVFEEGVGECSLHMI